VHGSNHLKRIPLADVVAPAKARVQKILKILYSGFRRNDGKSFRLKAGLRKQEHWDQQDAMRPSGRSLPAPLRGSQDMPPALPGVI
jgi:hypothetical protein